MVVRTYLKYCTTQLQREVKGSLCIHSRWHLCHKSCLTCTDPLCLPCDAVRLLLQPVNERLRLLGGTAKVALDLLEYDSQLERAFITICGCAMLFGLFSTLPLSLQDAQCLPNNSGCRQGTWKGLLGDTACCLSR